MGVQIKQFGRINKFFNFLPNQHIEKNIEENGRNSKGQVGHLKQIPTISNPPPPPQLIISQSAAIVPPPPRLRP